MARTTTARREHTTLGTRTRPHGLGHHMALAGSLAPPTQPDRRFPPPDGCYSPHDNGRYPAHGARYSALDRAEPDRRCSAQTLVVDQVPAMRHTPVGLGQTLVVDQVPNASGRSGACHAPHTHCHARDALCKPRTFTTQTVMLATRYSLDAYHVHAMHTFQT